MSTESIHQNLSARQAYMEWVRHFNKRATNRLTMRFAGKHVYAVIHHTGRKSGKAYQTPVVAMPQKGYFIIPLPYGKHVDWCCNLLAAGSCRMEWRGRDYPLRAPQLIGPQEALPAFPRWVQFLLRDTDAFLKMECPALPEAEDLAGLQPDRRSTILRIAALVGVGFLLGWLLSRRRVLFRN